jgi:HAD superfamily hydrolase (TIGR01456 family)
MRRSVHSLQRSLCGARRGFRTHAEARVGVSFDIDGVLLRGNRVLEGAREALLALIAQRVPFIFLTNGGGEREWRKAAKLSDALQLPVHPEQVVLSHSPLRPVVARHAEDRILVLGCRDVMDVARSYGARHAVDIPMLTADDPRRYPFIHYEHTPMPDPDRPFAAAFILHDPNDWAPELQITLDVLRGGVPLGSGGNAQQIPIYASNMDLVYSASHPVPRLAAGAFSVALSSLWKAVTGTELAITKYGKPERVTFDFAHAQLQRWAVLADELGHWHGVAPGSSISGGRAPPPHRALTLAEQADAAALRQVAPAAAPCFRRILHVGDNPAADVRGANGAGEPWRSVLVRTGLFQGPPGGNDPTDPARYVLDGVGDAARLALQLAAEAGARG